MSLRIFPIVFNVTAAVRAVSIAILVLMLAACGERREAETETLPVDQLYSEAKSSLDAGNFERAIRYYKRLTSRFPFGDYSEQAQLDLAFAQYKRSDYDEAVSTVNRFVKTYPAHPKIDYAYYLRGLVNFDRNRSYIDRLLPSQAGNRDLEAARQSFNDFSELLRRYPQSSYAADARQRMVFLRNDIANSELTVARYYFRRGAYVGAANRAKYIVENYQQAAQIPDALALMVQSYEALGQKDLADDARRVLEANAPGHPYLTGVGNAGKTSWWSKLWPF
ncbi:MAG: outer membrane protein assembly factor BamD [Rhodanobacteraceae bacterium]|nr:outer membrane protein assembly factor BamD [Rhodanobacteraceae bacterium]